MIEGFKIEITTQELRDHINARVKYHQDKAAFYEKNAANLKEGGMQPGRGYSNDPVAALMSDVQSHKRKAGYFAFIAKHLIEKETYRLSESDLARLEILEEMI